MLPAGAELTSVRSPRVKAARQLGKRALRQRARAFLAEGPQAVAEALAARDVVSELFVTATAQGRYADLAARARTQGAAVHAVSGEVMAELAQTVTPQGVLAVCRFVDVPLTQVIAGEAGYPSLARGGAPEACPRRAGECAEGSGGSLPRGEMPGGSGGSGGPGGSPSRDSTAKLGEV